MVATLDDYMNGKISSSNSSVPTLDDYMNNGVAQKNSVTPRVTSQPKSPSAVPTPVNKKVTVGEGLGNIGTAISEGVGNFAQTVANDPLGFAKDTVNSLVVKPVQEFGANVLNPDTTKSPWLAMGGGVVKGAVALPQNLWNLGVDAVNAYNNTPEQNQYKANYVEDIANALKGNQLYQNMYQKPKQANESVAELSSFAAPMAVAGKISKTANAINKANKVASESTRIASKLSDAQKAKYANQIQKLAQNNVDKGIATKTAMQQLPSNVATGFGLGALEGDTLQERVANGAGVAALGGALSLAHVGAQKAWNSKQGLEFRNNSAETLKNLTTDYDKVSQAVAGIDNALNTNLSKNASDLTRTRKEYLDKLSKNQNYKRHISDKEKALLEDAGKLTDEQQTEIFERNKYGNRERALRISKEVKAELAKEKQEAEAPKEQESNIEQKQTEQFKQEPETTVKTQEEADKWFKEREEFAKKLEESKNSWEEQQKTYNSKDDLSHVKSETDINTPKDIKTPQNEPLKQTQNEDMKLDFTNVKGQSVKHEVKSGIEFPNAKIDESKVTRIEGGTAEGANSGNWYELRANTKPKRLGDENMYENYEVEGTKPTTDAELMQEIEAAKRQKDVPVIRSEAKNQQRTPAQRMFDKRHNEIKQKAWYKQLKNTKVKALNDDAKTKSMLDIVYEGQGQSDIKGSSPKMQSARKAEVNPSAKIKPYEGDSPAGNTLRDAETWKNVENEKINKDITNEEKWLGNPDRPYNDLGLLYDKDTTPVSKAIQDISKTKFAKADRIYTSHKIKDFADDISGGNSDVANAIKEFVDDKHTFDFDDLPEDSHGRTYTKNDTFTINSNDTVERQLGTASHETHHILFHKIAEACGKDSVEYKIYQEGLDANNAVHEFETNYPEIKRTKNEIDKLLSNKDTAKKGLDLIDKLDNAVYDKLIKYKRLIKKYENTKLEQEANLSKNGKWVFNGKDISYYYDKLKIHGGRTQQSVGENSGNVKRGTGEISARRQEQGDVSSNSGKGKQHLKDGFLEDKGNDKLIHRTLDWFDKTKNKHTKFYHQFLEAAPEIKRFTDAYKAIQDKREAFFREFGTYTDERMKARLFKQSKSGEGVYFQQGTKRNEKVDWGKESNTKAGFTGHKELEGISEKGTTQEGLARGFSDIVRMEHTRNCIQFLKDNFSKEQEGYIPVNSKLLANAMYFGKSKAWYETIRKGQEAIEKTFDEKNAKEWNELYRTTEADKSDIYLPKDLLDLSITGEKELPLDYLATYGKVLGTKGRIKGMAKIAGAMLEFYTDRFKRKVLTSASFFANNRFGNQIMLAMSSDNPTEYIKGIANAFRLKESEVPTQILESTLAEAIQHEANTGVRKYFSEKNNNFDNFARVLDGDYSDLSTLSGGEKITAKAFNIFVSAPNRLFRSLSKITGEINERFERFERKQAYAQTLSKMQRNKVLKVAKQFAGIHELAEAAKKDALIREAVIDKVADMLGDYNNFNKFEKNFMKKLIPFYAWNRTITRHIIHLAKDNPVKATLVAYETYRLLNQDDGLEDYQHGSLKTGMYNSRTKSNVVINKASMIPYNTLFDMVSGENIGSFSPLITKPIEAVRGEKFFKPASEITSKNWKRTTKDKKHGYQNIKTGEFREGKAPASVRAGYLAKDAMETVYPMAGSPMTKGIPDAIKHYNKTGEFLFPDKQYDANLGGFYDGDKAGKYKRGKKNYDRKLSARNRLDLKYQLMNRTLGLGIQPEHKVSKEQKDKYQQQRKRMRGY